MGLLALLEVGGEEAVKAIAAMEVTAAKAGITLKVSHFRGVEALITPDIRQLLL